jgi:hypothetical protein
MSTSSDEIFLIDSATIRRMPNRSMREGLLGKTLEDALQYLMEQYPQLIPGKQIAPSSDDPPRFILLRREMPIGSWSLDHLYVDQRGVLTLVETKLAQNPESRREVIGQIMEYATNAFDAWGEGKVRATASDYYSSQGKNLDEALQNEFSSESFDVDLFWQQVEENLRRKRIRLIIAGDQLRPEVRGMIEFINSEMQNVEILGLELGCYGESDSSVVIVPRIIGQSLASSERRSSSSDATVWVDDKIKTGIEDISNDTIKARFSELYDLATSIKRYKPSKGKSLSFQILGKNDIRIFNISGNGGGYIVLRDVYHAGGVEARDKFAMTLKEIGILDSNCDPASVSDGKSFSRNISELSADEFSIT